MCKLIDISNVRTYPQPEAILLATNIIAAPENSGEACAWSGITCAAKHVVSIVWPNGVSEAYGLHIRPRALDLRWLPPYAANIDIRDQGCAHGPFETRFLPRFSSRVNMSRCGLRGCLNLKTLPAVLIHLNLASNYFSGTVNFFSLPAGVRTIDLTRNQLVRGYVWNLRLPHALKAIYLDTQMGKKGFVVKCMDSDEFDYKLKPWVVNGREYLD